jgi:hypothetical protein
LNAVGSKEAAADNVVAFPMVAVPGSGICPPAAVKVVIPPSQIDVGFFVIVIALGTGSVVTVTVLVEEQPSALTPVTV